MSRLKSLVRRILRLPGVPQARFLTEKAVAPYVRDDVASMHDTVISHDRRLEALESSQQVAALAARMEQIERHQPAVLNAIRSTYGTARLLRREVEQLRTQTDERLAAVDRAVGTLRTDVQPHLDSLAWLTNRVETVRAEVLYELRYGRASEDGTTDSEPHIVNPEALGADDVRVNLGCGHLPLDGYANVDVRELPGVDVVAAVDELPVEPGTIDEIFSAHLLEHFPQLELERRLLPYWFSMLRPGGSFRAVVPDLPSMITQYGRGEIDFEALRVVAYGGQEYEGDFHFNAFTPTSMVAALQRAGFDDVEVVEEGRVNGDCLEFEVTARRPA